MSGNTGELLDLVTQGDELFSSGTFAAYFAVLTFLVKQTREATLDSQLLEITSSIGVEKIQHLSTGLRQYNLQEYTSLVKKIILETAESTDDGWPAFYDAYVDHHVNRIPRITFLYEFS